MTEMVGRPRAAVAAMPAYRPGKGVAQAEAEHGIRGAIKLASNENPAATVDPIAAAVAAAAHGLNRYADHRATELRAALAATLGVDATQVTVGNGSSGVLQQVCLTYLDPGDEVVYPWRSFEVYPVYTQLMAATAVTVPLRPDWSFDLERLAAAVTPRTKVVFLATPNNPTGVATTTAELAEFVAAVPDDVIVCIDEAYREFCDPSLGDPVAELLPRFANVVVTRTFSKAHGLAGARLGYAVGHPAVIAAVDRTQLPFAVSALAQVAGLAALAHADVIGASVAAIVAERGRVEAELAGRGWTMLRHQGNFVWLATGADTDVIAGALERRGVIVRPFSNEGIRVTIGNADENDRFLDTLDTLDGVRGV